MVEEPGSLIVGSENCQTKWYLLLARQIERSDHKLFVSNFHVLQPALRESSGQVAQGRALGLTGRERGRNDFIAVGENYLTRGGLADLSSQTIIDFVADDQETQQRPVRLGAKINRLHKSLVEVMGAKPPVTGTVFVQRSLYVILRRLAGQARRFRMERDYGAISIGQYQKIAAGQWP